MNQTVRKRKKTDQAWSNLYGRLEKEGLLSATDSRSSGYLSVIKWTSAVAAVLALCIYLSVGHFSRTTDQIANNLLTQQNKEATTTLVTTLEDGSVVYLAGNTSLKYPEHFSPYKREVALEGNALFDITGNRARPFLIETEEVRIEVLGTAFNVKSNSSTPFELSVKRGEVKVTLRKSGQDIHVKAGETVTLLSRKLHLSETQDPGQFARYTQSIRFKDESLGNILRIINMNDAGPKLQTTPDLESRRLTVTFSNNTPESMAELICQALNLRCTWDKNVLNLSE